MLKVILFITEHLMHNILILFVFCRDEKLSIFMIYYSVGAHAATTLS